MADPILAAPGPAAAAAPSPAAAGPTPALHDWKLLLDQEGIAWATFDREGESANSLGRRPLAELGEIVDWIETNAKSGAIKGLVLLSGKERGFIVGADIREFDSLQTEAQVREAIGSVNQLFERIERLSVPVVAAVHGVCVGGGLELILACHYRIATRDDSTRIGFPEVKLGIFPGFNGTARSIARVGAPAAMEAMLSGRMIRASAARGMGFLDELVASRGALHWAARKAVLQKRRSKPLSFLKGMLAKWPARTFLANRMREEVKKKAREEHYPAPHRLIDLFERHGGDLRALKINETRAFAPLMVSAQSKNLRRVFRLSELLKAQAPKGTGFTPTRVHVIGAGTMGADIAGWCVASGMEVTLQDLKPELIEKGMKAQGKLFGKKFKTKAQRDAAKARLIADPQGSGIARADVVIEAIIERLDVKQALFKGIEARLKPGAVLATNTSSLKIEDIASALADPGRLVGIHFFNPVAQMPLVEVVRGANSRADMVARAAVFVTAIDKLPLIVASMPGFLVNRVLTPYMFGAMQRIDRGESKERIDAAARAFGMPMGPIELADAVGLDVCLHVGEIMKLSATGSTLERLVMGGKLGKKTGEGFYTWADGKPHKASGEFDAADLSHLGRELVEPIVAEAQHALDEHVVDSADLVDAGLIFGTGFAPFRGGPLNMRDEEAKARAQPPARVAAE